MEEFLLVVLQIQYFLPSGTYFTALKQKNYTGKCSQNIPSSFHLPFLLPTGTLLVRVHARYIYTKGTTKNYFVKRKKVLGAHPDALRRSIIPPNTHQHYN